jgi:aspartate/methionine/tyrosine aminotransferase
MVRRLKEHSQRGAAGIVLTSDVIALGSGEPDFETPASIVEAMNEALARG